MSDRDLDVPGTDAELPDREMVEGLLHELNAERPSDLTGEDGKQFYTALAISAGLSPDDIVLIQRSDGSFRPELRADVLREREKIAACDSLVTRFLTRFSDLHAGEIEDMSLPAKVQRFQRIRAANADGED